MVSEYKGWVNECDEWRNEWNNEWMTWVRKLGEWGNIVCERMWWVKECGEWMNDVSERKTWRVKESVTLYWSLLQKAKSF